MSDLLTLSRKLWTPERPFAAIPGDRPSKLLRDRNGHVRVLAPLDLVAEMARIARDEWMRQEGIVHGAAAGAWTFPNSARTDMLNGTFDFDTDTFKIALFLSTSNIGAASTTYAGVTNEHANANGYTTGGAATTMALSGTTTVIVDGSDVTWTASGGSIVARFAVLYEVGGRVVCYHLLDSAPADVTVTDGNTLTDQLHANGFFTLA